MQGYAIGGGNVLCTICDLTICSEKAISHQAGISGMGMYALKLYYDTDESREGVKALQKERKPDFRKFAK